MVVVRRVTESDWERLRTIRLEMLADSPLAYLETVADAERRTEDEWRARVARNASGRESVGLAAEDEEGVWVGYLACFVTGPGHGHVVSVYVAPTHRGSDVATRLMDEVLAWARDEAGLERLLLDVHEHNTRAHAFYLRYGFVDTGRTQPYPLQPGTVEIEMAMDLAPPGAAVKGVAG